jgi:predicted MFS family arabinose efflux permease
MIQRFVHSYFASFRGLPLEIWWLSLITLINRAGTMVIPFLSLYLTKEKGFSLSDVGWIMSAFGLGSVIGAYLGGWLTDKIGAHITMTLSLGTSGIFYVLMQYAESFWSIAMMIFTVVLLADIFRPASFVAIRSYTDRSSQTRSTSLIRLAVNLGFSVGPAIGGLLIYNLGYSALFWVDGLTSMIAMVLLFYLLHPKRSTGIQEELVSDPQTAYKDKRYLLFILGMILLAFVFLQYFSTLPFYYSKDYLLSEKYIGLLLGFNGLVVFLVEMPLVHSLEKKGKDPVLYVTIGAFLLLISFLVLQLGHYEGLLWLGMVLMSFSEVLAFPFANTFALDRSKLGKTGEYMALYTISFSIAHIFAHNAGFQLIDHIGFSYTWWVMIGISVIMTLLFLTLKRKQ